MLADFVQSWGYPAVFVGTLLEGETTLLLGGFAAHGGYLRLPWVIAVAAAAAFLGDLFYFWLGRRYGGRILARFPRQAPRAARIRALLERHPLPVILALRFLYGLRVVGPIAIGTSSVHWARFIALDLVAALVWAVLGTGLGYLFGAGLRLWLGDLGGIELTLGAALVAVGAVIWGARIWLQRRRL